MESVKIDFLPWDSAFFELKVGKIDFPSNKKSLDFNEFKRLIRNSDYDLIYIITDLGQIPYEFYKKSKNIDLKLIDSQVHLEMSMPPKIKLLEYELITENNLCKYSNVDELYKISDEIAPFSRFNYDSRISKKKVTGLYHKFIHNSLEGSFGDGLILDVGSDGEINGLFALGSKGNLGREILIAVKKSYRGKGVGRRLFERSLNYWRDKGVKEIKTVVSAKNLDSLNFHLNMGYRISKIKNVYHLWTEKQI